jgi:hypothetical protein
VTDRVFVLADWEVDPEGVIAACRQRAVLHPATFAFVVPAWLHGLDWVGDPYAARPCAARQLDRMTRLAQAAGLAVEFAAVGDPDPASAVDDALTGFPATELLLCTRHHRHHPLDLAQRLQRRTGLRVDEAPIRVLRSPRRRRRQAAGHCPGGFVEAA